MTVANGNRTFPKPGEWVGDRPTITVASYPKLLRSVARRLQGHWLAFPIETVARDWNGDPAINIARLNDILAHAKELTKAQVSYLEAAIAELQERSKQHGHDTETDDQSGNRKPMEPIQDRCW